MEAEPQMLEPEDLEASQPDPEEWPAEATEEPREPNLGILMASVDESGTWAALKQLRAGLRRLRKGGALKVLFIDALDRDGKVVGIQDPGVAALVLGYSASPVEAPETR